MRPYSNDLRERIVAAVDHQVGSLREIAWLFQVSLSFLVRLLQRRRQANTLDPKPHAGGPPVALSLDDQRRLAELIGEHPDATLEQLKQLGGFTCTCKTLWQTLRRLGLTRKKKSLHASQRDRPDVQAQRQEFRAEVDQIDPKRLLLVDETGVTTTMTPAYAWSERGERAVDSTPASWESMTVLAALRLDGVCAPLAFAGATDTATFQAYVEQILVPALHKGDVVVLDNLKPHKAAGVKAAVERAGARVLPLPPYSPDYTPIEEMYSKFKVWLRRIAARTKGDLYEAIAEALRQMTREDILGWFKHAGLCATHG